MSALRQIPLFETTPTQPAGLRWSPDVITQAEELALLEDIAKLEFTPFQFRGFVGNRRTVSFGWRYDFNGGGFQAAAPLPEFLLAARNIAASFAGVDPERLVQASVLEYAPGAGIGWHRDRPQFGIVVGLSLLAPCRFRLRHETESGWKRASLELSPRSAYVLEGEARELWQHSIPVVDALRYSVTFRTLSPSGKALAEG